MTATRDDLLSRKMSLFDLVSRVTTSKELTVAQLLNGIRDGRWKDEVEPLRETYREHGREAYKEKRKTSLPAVTVSGLFRRRNNDAMEQHSGLVAVDLDNLGDRLAATKRAVIETGVALAVFTSPSGDGLKVLLPVAATDATSHRAAYGAALDALQGCSAGADTGVHDPARLCFVSYDPEIWVNLSPSLSLLSASEPVPVSTPVPIPCALYPIPILQEGAADGVAERIKRLKKLEEENPMLANLYEVHVMRRTTVAAGKRNESLAELVPYLHRAVGGIVAEKLMALSLEINRDVHHGSTEEQMASLKSLWDGCNERYMAGLSPAEANVYGALDRDEQAAFRIMRDLAIAGDGQFFMGCDQLQHRLGSGNGWRILSRFSNGYGIIEKVRAGQKWEKGARAMATSWRWSFPVPAPALAA